MTTPTPEQIEASIAAFAEYRACIREEFPTPLHVEHVLWHIASLQADVAGQEKWKDMWADITAKYGQLYQENTRLKAELAQKDEALRLCRPHMYEYASNTPDGAFDKLCAVIAPLPEPPAAPEVK
jgi:hypothetical protein